jgi:hypothetical protein
MRGEEASGAATAARGGPSRGSPGISPCPGGAVVSKAGGGQGAGDHRHQPTLGFCPFPEQLRRRGRGKGEGGRRGGGAVGAGEPRRRRRVAAAEWRVREEPGKGGAPCETEEKPDRSRGSSTAGSACYATPSTHATRLRLHRRPAVSAVAFSLFPCAVSFPCLCVWASLRAASGRARRAAVFPWATPRRAVPAGAWGRGYPKPRRPSDLAKFGSGQGCRKGWGPPRAAPSSSTPNARRAASPLCGNALSAASRLWTSHRGGM